jgi:hypothetical protein
LDRAGSFGFTTGGGLLAIGPRGGFAGGGAGTNGPPPIIGWPIIQLPEGKNIEGPTNRIGENGA